MAYPNIRVDRAAIDWDTFCETLQPSRCCRNGLSLASDQHGHKHVDRDDLVNPEVAVELLQTEDNVVGTEDAAARPLGGIEPVD